MEFDIFICHASEDKDAFVRPLAESLAILGLKVWYDEFTLSIGDSISEKIDHGLSNSYKGAVVISPYFFEKEWPRKELRGLVAREVAGEKVILPIWHGVTRGQVLKFSPTLADLVAIKSVEGIDSVAEQLAEVIRKIDKSKDTFYDDFSREQNYGLSDKGNPLLQKHQVSINLNKHSKESVHFELSIKSEGLHFLERALPGILEASSQKKTTILLADIDELTLINKTYSIDIGDKVLEIIFKLFKNQFKEITEHFGRCGDDTFFVILHGLGISKANKVTQSLRDAIINYNWHKLAQNLHVTCSFGLARLARPENSQDTVVCAALGMQEAKRTGRNKIIEGPRFLPITQSKDLRRYWS